MQHVNTLNRRYDLVCFDLYGTLIDIRTDESSPEAWQALHVALAKEGAHYESVDDVRQAFETAMDRVSQEAYRQSTAPAQEVEPDAALAYAALLGYADDDEQPVETSGSELSRLLSWLPRAWRPERAQEDARLAAVHRVAWAFRNASTRGLSLYPGAAELLETLRQGGCHVALVSNAQACYTRPELRILDLDRHFDTLLLSSEVGARKPGAAIFRMALKAAGVGPARAVMVGNEEQCDIVGARGAEINGIFLRTEISRPDDPASSQIAVASFTGADYDGVLRTVFEN